jgi:subtilisin family serine protease
MRLPEALLLAALLPMAAAPAAALDLPVVNPALEPIESAAYRADRIELRLAPEASRLAAIAVASQRAAEPARLQRPALGGLGVPAIDRVAAALGGARFVPEFRGEVPPAPGSGLVDLAAFFLVDLPAGAALEDALVRFGALPEVVSVSRIAVLPVAAIPNDSLWTSAYWLFQPSRADIHAPEAWDVSMGDPSIVVAILDTGVLPHHPDLGGTLAGDPGHMWVNEAERNGIAGIDDDGNGFVDDVSGWDFVDLASGSGIPPAEDWDIEDPDPNDYAGHGTFVAGFAGAIPNNGIGLPGAAWNVRIMPVRMAWATNANPLGLVDMSFAAQAIHYAWRSGAHVINASWASLIQSGLDVAARTAMREGVTIVSAAGNNGQPHELAEFDDVIAVAATDASDVLAGFSNRGPWIDVSAPGANMAGTFIARPGTDSLDTRAPAYADGLSGTSFAAPLVSGAAALVHAHRRALGMKPITATGMRMRLRETADDIGAINPSGGFGAGRLP